MPAKMTHIPPADSSKFLTDQVNRLIKNFESGHVQVQVVTTVCRTSAARRARRFTTRRLSFTLLDQDSKSGCHLPCPMTAVVLLVLRQSNASMLCHSSP